MYPYTDIGFFLYPVGTAQGVIFARISKKNGSPTYVNDVTVLMVLSGNPSFYETTKYSLKEA
jgi:hypothetical protein